jgi:GT2 family glycosyltransferase
VLARLVSTARSFVAERRRLAGAIERLMYRFPLVEDTIVALIRGDPRRRYEKWINTYDKVDQADLARMRADLAALAQTDLFSVVVLRTDENGTLPSAFGQSLNAQVFPPSDVRVLGTSVTESFATTTSGYVVVVGPSVVLRPHSLLLLAHAIAQCSDVVLLYGDDDQIDPAGRRSHHYFKPDWNPALLRSQNYLGGVVCFRRAAAVAAGGLQGEGDPLWGLSLRVTEDVRSEEIQHLPFILSHRLPDHRASDPAKREGIAQALEEQLGRSGVHADVRPVGEKSYRARYSLSEDPPRVSIVVPTTCRLDVLPPCVFGVLERTSYPDFELVLVINGNESLAPEQRRFLEDVEGRSQVRVLYYGERPYNFAKTNNWAVEQADGELLCFLNDDTEVIGADWLSALVNEVLQDRVAASGAMLLYPNDRIQHAGVILGVGGVAAHAFRGSSRGTLGYHDRAVVAHDVSCVTAACMLVRREAFAQVGGFDPTFATAFNDVDFCLRLRNGDWRIVWTPLAELYHKESASIGRHHLGERAKQWSVDYDLIRARWGRQLVADPDYSPNLSLDGLEVWEPAFPPRVAYPWSQLDPGPW